MIVWISAEGHGKGCVDVEPGATVADLSAAAAELLGMDRMVLNFGGAELSDPSALLSDLGVGAQAEVCASVTTSVSFAPPPEGGGAWLPSRDGSCTIDGRVCRLTNGSWASWNILWDSPVPPGCWEATVRMRHPREGSFSKGFFYFGVVNRNAFLASNNSYMNSVAHLVREDGSLRDGSKESQQEGTEAGRWDTALKGPLSTYNDGLWTLWVDTRNVRIDGTLRMQAAFEAPDGTVTVMPEPITSTKGGDYASHPEDELHFFVTLNVQTDEVEWVREARGSGAGLAAHAGASTGGAPAAAPEAPQVEQMVSMGFARGDAERELRRAGGNVEAAVERLLSAA